ncbi:MAG: ribosome recycling factor [Chlamydiales bacterium]|nr:ribosome recycling factor [Chlamydiales bacterium]
MPLKQVEEKMAAAIEHLKQELKNIRTGRANPGMLDNVTLEVYGTQMRLRDVASVTTPEPRQILITPFDANNAHAIAKGIEKANMGYQPVVDGKVVRINIPQMDADTRKEMVKLAYKRCEECKVSVRHVRRDFIEEFRKQKTNGDMSEDDLKRYEKSVQDATDKYCHKADEVVQVKEREILHI